ncbi:MAG: amino acid permease [Proteobacteria bacterium]|nr:amino acid permease [Pseudomonadota bacterium]
MSVSGQRRLGLTAATAIVVANMIGTGVFISAGYMVHALDATASLIAWLVGGVLALCGAAVYAELGAMMPRVGGEYVYLREGLHPAVGFLSGWVSLIAGFSAPIAVAALAFGRYSHAVIPALPGDIAALGLIAFVTGLHAVHVAFGSSVQTAFTAVKVVLISIFIVAGLAVGNGDWANLDTAIPGATSSIVSGEFAVQLFWVSFAYAGWNAAAYVAGEIKDPGRNLPRALFIGTAIVTVLYLLLNLVFLYSAPAEKLSAIKTGLEIGTSSAIALFGESAGVWLSTLIALALVSTVSAMVMAGPRVYAAMAEDGLFFRFFAVRHNKGGPLYSVLLQGIIAAALALYGHLDELVRYIGFTLSIFAALAVVAAFTLRRHRPDALRPYRATGWPVTPAVFVILSMWLIAQGIRMHPKECLLWGGLTLSSGIAVYFLWNVLAGVKKDLPQL